MSGRRQDQRVLGPGTSQKWVQVLAWGGREATGLGLSLPIAPYLHSHQCHADVTLSPSGQCLRGSPVVERPSGRAPQWVGGPPGVLLIVNMVR